MNIKEKKGMFLTRPLKIKLFQPGIDTCDRKISKQLVEVRGSIYSQRAL